MPTEYTLAASHPAAPDSAVGWRPRRAAARILSLLILCLVATPVAAEVPTARSAAEEPAAEGSPPASEAEYRRRIAEEPLEPAHPLALARLLVGRGTSQRALTLLAETAIGWMRIGRYEEAAELMEMAVEIAPESARTWLLLGRARALARSYRAAQEPLERAVELGDRSTMTLVMLGSTLWENGALERAERVLVDAAGTRGRDSVVALHQLGKLRLWQGRSAAAAEALETVVSSRPDWAEPWLDLARALQAEGRHREARAHFEAYLARVPDDPGAHYGLALTLRTLGEDEPAAEQMRRAAELQERDRRALLASGRLEAALDEAAYLLGADRPAAARELLESLPRTVEVASLLSRVLAVQGDRAAAIRTLEEALALDPGRADLRARLQALYLEDGDGS